MSEPLDPLDPPEHIPERRKHYQDLEDKVDAYQKANKAELKWFIKRALIAFAVIAIFTAVAIFGFGIVLTRQSQIFDDIQAQRYDVAYTLCIDQNRRHDRTFETLDRVAEEAATRAKTDAEKLQMEQGVASSKLLIEALQPRVEDCKQVAEDRVKGDV